MTYRADSTAYFTGETGPDLVYEYFAEIAREPHGRGLNGGRILNLEVRKTTEVEYTGDPVFDEPKSYFAWIIAQPRCPVIADYENGALTLDASDPHAARIVAELNDFFTEKNRDVWGYKFENSRTATPDRQRGQNADEGR